MINVVGTDTNFPVTRRLTLEDVDADGNTNVLTTNFVIKLEFPACTTFVGGTGDSATPYEIDNIPRLDLMSHLVNNNNDVTPSGSPNTYAISHYKITADIDMSTPGLPFNGIGSKTLNEIGTAGNEFSPIGRNL